MSRSSRHRYYSNKGFINSNPKPTTFSRSEEGTRYEYNNRTANQFAGWSSKQRDAGKIPTFRDFYDQLDEDTKSMVTVTQIFKGI